ncbi:MAG: hypothetical protein HDT43_00055 [Ruminococcaceae bacterium]|nr:hypothetical protein [Oscillospiraceae bacterium]
MANSVVAMAAAPDEPTTEEATTEEATTEEATTEEATTEEATTEETGETGETGETEEPSASDTSSSTPASSAPSGNGSVSFGPVTGNTTSNTSSDTTSTPVIDLPEQTEEFKAEVKVDSGFSADDAAVVEKIEFFTPADTFPEGTVPSIKPAANVTADNAFALDITFELDGAAVQPKDGAAVTVAVPVPAMFAGVDQSTLKVFYFDGTNYTAVAGAKVADGMVKFTTNHFSTYVISTENLVEKNTPATNDNNTPATNPTTGVAAMAVLPVVAVAGAVIIVAKKRK